MADKPKYTDEEIRASKIYYFGSVEEADRVHEWCQKLLKFEHPGTNFEENMRKLKTAIDSLLAKVESKKWYRCPACKSEYTALRPSGKCVHCDPERRQAAAPTNKASAVDTVFGKIGIDSKSRASGE